MLHPVVEDGGRPCGDRTDAAFVEDSPGLLVGTTKEGVGRATDRETLARTRFG